MKIGIYNRYWNTYGGGEKHIGGIAQYLSKYGTVDLIGHELFSIPQLENRLNLQLSCCKTVIIPGETEQNIERLSSNYDLWITGTFQSSARSNAECSILFVMFPYVGNPLLYWTWKICPLERPKWIQQLLWGCYGFWNSYDLILANSTYTQYWIKKWWGTKSEVLEPYVDIEVCPSLNNKHKIILSVGRFFVGGHSKRQDIIVKAFKELYDSGAGQGWEFHICGGSDHNPINQEYLKNIIQAAKGYPIFIHPDIKRDDLLSLYKDASIFWHAAGYNVNERRNPEQLEHFGIATVEAMIAGCIPLVHAKGGQKEIVKHGANGFLWHTLEELKKFTKNLMDNPEHAHRLRKQAVKVGSMYSYDVFSKNLSNILAKIL